MHVDTHRDLLPKIAKWGGGWCQHYWFTATGIPITVGCSRRFRDDRWQVWRYWPRIDRAVAYVTSPDVAVPDPMCIDLVVWSQAFEGNAKNKAFHALMRVDNFFLAPHLLPPHLAAPSVDDHITQYLVVRGDWT